MANASKRAGKAPQGPAQASPAKKSIPQQPKAPEPKILRIGVIQAGKIIEERLIRRRENVTIGASPRNTLVVPASSLPRSFVLFEMNQGQYSMRFGDSMDGRVSVGGQVMALDQVRQSGSARTGKQGLYVLPLNEQSRGKVLLGEVTLLFQFVSPPPIQPRPQLPPSVRGGMFQSMDWVLASSFITLAVLHFGFLLYLRTLDFPRTMEPDVIPDRFAEYIPEVEKPKTLDLSALAKQGEKAVEKDEGPKKAAGGQAKRKSGGPAKPCDKACQEARAAARRARLSEAVSKMGVLKLLGTKGQGAGGSASNLIGTGDPGTEVDKAFSGVGGVAVAGKGGGGGLRGKGGGGSGNAVGIGDLGGRVGGPGKVGTGKMVTEKVPKAIVDRSTPDIDGTMDTGAVGRVIRRGMTAVKSCYQRALKRNPNLAGKITIRLVVNTMGKVTSVEIDADSVGDPTVTSCIKGYAQRWRFPPPEGGSAEIAVPFNFKSSQ